MSPDRPLAPGKAAAPTTVPAPAVHLLEVEPDLGRDLDPQQRTAANQLALPVCSVTNDNADIDELIAKTNALGVLIVDGALLRQIRVNSHAALQLLGPGDIYMHGAEPGSALLAESHCLATSGTKLALLDNDILVATNQWPRLVAGLLRRIAKQAERISLQLAVSQLPRVEDRLLAIFELISDQWGYLTPQGRMIPLRLTHETLGGLVGARRPTVTLALHTLADQGELTKDSTGWLLRHDVTARRGDHEPPHGRKAPPIAAGPQ